jgi:hypothetical protein
MPHVAGDDVEPHVDLAEEGLDLDHLGHLAGGGDEFVEGARRGLVEREAQETSTSQPRRRQSITPPRPGSRPPARIRSSRRQQVASVTPARSASSAVGADGSAW